MKTILALLALAFAASGCVVAPEGGYGNRGYGNRGYGYGYYDHRGYGERVVYRANPEFGPGQGHYHQLDR